MKKIIFLLMTALLTLGATFAQEIQRDASSSPYHRATVSQQGVQSYGTDFFVESSQRNGTQPDRAPSNIFFEGFESTTGNGLPTGWTRVGATVSGSAAVAGAWCSAAGWALFNPAYAPYAGNRLMVAQKYNFNGSTTPMNAWLFTPALSLTAGVTYEISFVVAKTLATAYGMDRFKVQIGQTTTTTTTGTGTSTVVNMNDATTLYNNTTDWFEWTVITANYTAAATGNHYIGFHCYSVGAATAGGLGICLDNVSVGIPRANDIALASSYPYSQVPVNQPPLISAKAKNIGTSPQTTVVLNSTLNGANIGPSAAVATLNPGEVATLTIPTTGQTYLTGANNISYTVTQSQTDGDLTDNTGASTFTGTTNLFATDDGIMDTYFYGSATAGYGNIYTFTKPTKICQVQSYFYYNSSGTNASTYGVQIHEVTGENTINTTPLYSQSFTKSSTATEWATANITPTDLPAGSYFVCVTGANINILGDANTAGRGSYIYSFGDAALDPQSTALFVRITVDLKLNDLQSVANGFPYTNIPKSQAAALPFPTTLSGKAYNTGLNPQTNVKLAVAYNGTPLGTSTPIASLAALTTSADMTVTTPAGTVFPVTVGTNNVVYTVSQDETDENLADNTQTYSFNITEDLYSVDGVTNLAAGGGGTSTANYRLGNYFTISQETSIKQVLVAFSGNNAALDFNAQIYSRTGNTIAASPIFSQAFTKPAAGGWITVNVPPTLLPAGDYFLCVQQLTTTNPGILFDEVPGRYCYAAASGVTTATQITNPWGAFGMRMVIEDPVYVNITTNVTPAGAGTVTGGGQRLLGSTVTLTAVANTGYIFQKWSDNVTDNPRSFTATEDATYTAVFEEFLIDACVDQPVGNGTTTSNYLPADNWNSYGYAQQIYTAADLSLPFVGSTLINSISFQLSFTAAYTWDNQTIYLGNIPTTKTAFTSNTDWIPVGQLQQVFTGSINYPLLNNGWFTINFQTPFIYTGGNLVIAYLNNRGSYTGYSTSLFYTHTESNKALYYGSDSSPVSAISPAAGTRPTVRSNVKFNACGAYPTVDMKAVSITGPIKPNVNTPTDYTVTVENRGKVPATNFTVSVLSEANVVLGSTTVSTPLAVGATTPVTVSATFTQVGTLNIKGKVEIAADEVSGNNETGLFAVNVFPEGVEELLITGTPISTPSTTGTDQIPFGFYHNNSITQSIYLESELNWTPGKEIRVISYNYVASTALPAPRAIKVYIAHTDLTTLSAGWFGGWLPYSQFTTVYTGTALIPATSPNVHELVLILDNPFVYQGGNICVMTEKVYAASTYTSGVIAQRFPATNRTRTYANDTQFSSTSNAGTLLSYLPVTHFYTLKDFTLNPNNIYDPTKVQITLNPDPVNYGSNGTVTFNVLDPCCYISDVIINGTIHLGANATSYVFTNVKAELPIIEVVTAYYQKEVAVTYGSNGAILYNNTVVPNGNVVSTNCGTSPMFVIKPDQGYTIATLEVDGVSKPIPANRRWTFTDISENHTIHATFVEFPQCIISFESAPVVGGEVIPVGREDEAPNGYISVDSGTMFQQFLFVPADHYILQAVYIDGVYNMVATLTQSHVFMNIVLDHHIKAVFKKEEFIIVATAGTNGTITPSGNVSVPYLEDKTFTFTPNIATGYEIDQVMVDGVNDPTAVAAGFYTFEAVAAPHTIYVSFKKAQYVITASASGCGAVSPDGEVTVTHNDIIQFTFNPNEGCKVAMVYVDGMPYPNAVPTGSYTFYFVTAPHTIFVEFEKKTYPITAQVTEHGTITDQGTTYVEHGDNKTYQFSALNGYEIASVKIDGLNNFDALAAGEYTFTSVTSPHTIDVIIAPKSYNISAYAGEGGYITPTGNIAVTYQGNQVFNFAALPGYEIDEVLVDNVVNVAAAESGTYAFVNVHDIHTIYVSFKMLRYQIYASAPGVGGGIAPTGITEITYFDDITYTITPEENYKISYVMVNGENMGAIETFTFSNVEINSDIQAFFFYDPVGISDPTLEGLTIYSNTNVVYIVNEKNLPLSDLSIFDMYGRIVWQGIPQGNSITLNVANGIYAVRVTSGENFTVTKVPIQR